MANLTDPARTAVGSRPSHPKSPARRQMWHGDDRSNALPVHRGAGHTTADDPVTRERAATIRALTQIMADLLLAADPGEVFVEYERLRLVRRLTGGMSPYRELLTAATPPVTEPTFRGLYGTLLQRLDSRPSAATPARVPPPRRAPLTAARAEARRNGLL